MRFRQRRRPLVVLLAGLGASMLALALFADLAEDVAQQETRSVDRGILSLVALLRTPEFTRTMVVITALGDARVLVVVSIAAIVASLYRGRRAAAAMVVVVGAGAMALNLALKALFARPRPPLELWLPGIQGASAAGPAFPSGHAMVSLCVYGFLAYLALRAGRPLVLRVAVAAACVLLIAAIGFSRIYLGVHWPTDVAAGYLAGALWLAACIAAHEWLGRR